MKGMAQHGNDKKTFPADLFDPHLAARRTDVSTSHEAAASMESTASRHHAMILNTLKIAGQPLAAEQIADRTLIDKVAVCRRFAELERAGLIERTDEKHLNRSGRHAFKCALVAQPLL